MTAATNLEDARSLVKVLAATSPGEYVLTNLTGDKTSIKFPPQRIMFEIGYDEKELQARADIKSLASTANGNRLEPSINEKAAKAH